MDCWRCRRQAAGTCRFCGRGACPDHVEDRAYLLATWPVPDALRALVVEDALWCGTCKVRPTPIELPELLA